MVRAEELFCIFMRPGLILAREVEVYIRDLVAAEAQEGLEGDVEALLLHLLPAVRAVLIRHVRAAAVARAGLEVRVVALGADVVRRQAVHLRDAGHVGHDGRAHAAPAAHQVAVRI